MNNTSDPHSSQTHVGSDPEGTANPKASSQPGDRLFESLLSAVNEGARQAKDAVGKAIPKVKTAVSEATYWLGYGVSFATVFSYTVIKELAPEVLKRGCCEGAQAGQRTAEDLASKLQAQPAAHGANPSPGPDASGSGQS